MMFLTILSENCIQTAHINSFINVQIIKDVPLYNIYTLGLQN